MPVITFTYQSLAHCLENAGFKGNFTYEWSALAAAAVDNSVYQIQPDAILSPINTDDLVLAMQVLKQVEFSHLSLTARGGATGTNGQSLNTGIIIDFKRYMNDILTIDTANKEATIEPGVVLEEINFQLKKHGLFFAPHTSSGNRCTIGGMIATDASGKGSRVYGKTGDNILGLQVLLANGECLDLMTLTEDQLGLSENEMLKKASDICAQTATKLEQRIPKLARHFVGYDIIGAHKKSGFDPVKLFVGAEGTLGMVTEARLKLLDIPKHKRLVLIGYDSFYAALKSATLLLEHEPTAIETIDDHIQTLAHRYGIADRLPTSLRTALPNGQVPICNFVEYAGDDLKFIDQRIQNLIKDLKQTDSVVAWHIAEDEQEIEKLWDIRKLSAGLLGRAKGKRTPIPFIEDCVVGAENIADFAMEFRALLDDEGVEYGMYGHVDVGCLHIRPALDMQSSEDQVRLKRISDNVYTLVEKYDGIFWGEHGKGVRGQYLQKFVGETVYQSFAKIKGLFDPNNRMNPGKLVTPNADENELWQIDKTPFRSYQKLDENEQPDTFHDAYRCNGNAMCLSYEKTTPMCPSYKATGDIRHSPKGRANILRNWRELQDQDKSKAIEDQVYDAMNGCLGCKACSTSCPVQVDIPELKASFFEHYFRDRKRPFKHVLFQRIEQFALIGQKTPQLLNGILNLSISKKILNKAIGLRDLPDFSPPLLSKEGVKVWSIDQLNKEKQSLNEKAVFLLPDSFNTGFDQQALLDVNNALQNLGYSVYVAECLPAGKPIQNIGKLHDFKLVAKRYAEYVQKLSSFDVPIIVIEPTHAALLRYEYTKIVKIPVIMTVSEFLNQEINQNKANHWNLKKIKIPSENIVILLHCTERSLFQNAAKEWEDFFKYLGIKTSIPQLGCCGMAGTYGYEIENFENSQKLFSMSWEQHCCSEESGSVTTATGFSCRSQIKRNQGEGASHPLSFMS